MTPFPLRKKRVIVIWFAVILLSLAGLTIASRASTGRRVYATLESINMLVNGKPIESPDVKAIVYDGSVYVRTRDISNALGTQIQWDGTTDTLFIGAARQDQENENQQAEEQPQNQPDQDAQPQPQATPAPTPPPSPDIYLLVKGQSSVQQNTCFLGVPHYVAFPTSDVVTYVTNELSGSGFHVTPDPNAPYGLDLDCTADGGQVGCQLTFVLGSNTIISDSASTPMPNLGDCTVDTQGIMKQTAESLFDSHLPGMQATLRDNSGRQ